MTAILEKTKIVAIVLPISNSIEDNAIMIEGALNKCIGELEYNSYYIHSITLSPVSEELIYGIIGYGRYS